MAFETQALFWNGGEGEIRTHGTLTGTAVFKTAALNRSATSPYFDNILFLLAMKQSQFSVTSPQLFPYLRQR
jgi:hypothetical protein